MQPPIALVAALILAWAPSADPGAVDFARTLTPAARIRLPGALAEVSGLAPAGASSVFAHNDEQATIHEIDIRSGKTLRSASLGRPPLIGDFEGIIAQDRVLSLITSRGKLFTATLLPGRRALDYRIADAAIDKSCEIEGIAPSANGRFLACKRAKRRLIIYEWTPAKGARKAIDLKLDNAVPNPEAFRATELAHDAATDTLLVLDSAAGAILEISLEGRPVAYWRLGGDHPQAEGLALMSDGRLAVADEGGMGGGSLGAGALTIYPPRR